MSPTYLSSHFRAFLISFESRPHMSSLPPTHPPLVASVPDVDNASCASLLLGHPLLGHPPIALPAVCGNYFCRCLPGPVDMSAFRCRTHARLLDALSTPVALLLIQISHVLLGFTCACSEVFTNLGSLYLHTSFKCYLCLYRCHNACSGDTYVP